MKNKFLLFCLFLAPTYLFAQNLFATVEMNTPIVSYTVSEGENINSIAEKFKTEPQTLLSLNQLQSNVELHASQILKAPVSKVLLAECDGMNCIKVYYKTQPSEGLYRIGKNFGYIKVAELKRINSLHSESLGKDQVLLVGYLSKEIMTAKASSTGDMNSVNVAKEVSKNTGNENTSPATSTKELSVATSQNASSKTQAISTPPAARKNDSINHSNLRYTGPGFFQDQYEQGHTDAVVKTAIFKSESGWLDGKFYVLADEPSVGKVVRLKHPVTGITIFAKVLGALPKLKEKEPVVIRVSSATAAALGFIEGSQNFELEMSY